MMPYLVYMYMCTHRIHTATLQHSISSPSSNTPSFPSRPQSAPLNRSTSFPITGTPTTIQSRELCSIEEERPVQDPTSPAHGTHVSEKSLLVSRTFTAEIFSSLQMSGIGGTTPHPPNSHSGREEPIGRISQQCTELNSSPRYPLRRASLRQGQEMTLLKQANGGASNSSVHASSQAVSFEVGGDVPLDSDSQLNFPMDNTTPSHSSTPAEVRSKQVYQNQNDSLTKALTASLQQANEWTRYNTPRPIATDKTSVEATDQGSDEACFVASEGKSRPPKLVPNAHLPAVPEVKREVNGTTPATPAPVTSTAANGAVAHHVALSTECK